MKTTILYVGATQFYSFVLTAGISFLPTGTFAIFKYVQNLANKVQSLLIAPFITVFFTQYSNLLQRSKSVEKQFQKYLTSIININIISIIGTILLGDYIINSLWGSKKFNINNVELAYVFLLFNIFAVLIGSLGSIYRKMAVSHGKGKELYFMWVFAQLLTAGFSYVFIKYYQNLGLFFIIPLNVFFMSLASFLIYKRTNDPLDYKFMNKSNTIGIILIVIAVLFKWRLTEFPLLVLTTNNLIIFCITSIFLSIYPIFNTYKVLRK